MNRFLHMGFFLILIVVVVSSSFLFVSVQKEEQLEWELHDDIIPGALAMSEMQNKLNTAAYLVSHLCSFEEYAEVEEKLTAAIDALEKEGAIHLQHEQHMGELAIDAATELLSRMETIHSNIDKIIGMRHAGTDLLVLQKYEIKKIHPTIHTLNTLLERHKNIHMQELNVAQDIRQVATERLNKLMLLAGIVIVVVLIVIWILTIRTLNRFVRKQSEARQQLRNGAMKQQQVQEEMRRLVTAIDQASEAVVITDLKATIQYVNPAFEKLSGYSREEALGQNPRLLQSGRNDRTFYKTMWKTLLRGEVWRGHFTNKKKDGSLFEEEATISPVRNDEGQITNFVAVKRDVSREVSLEKQLRQAMKMEAIGTLAGGIAHDFNNILSAILGYSELAKQELRANDQIGNDLDQVIKAGHRATGLVRQILTFSRQGEEKLQPLKIQPIIKEALKLLRASLPTTIQLQERIDADCGLVLADSTQIHQVLMNLCTNAKHAIGDELGTLTVMLSEREVTDAGTVRDCPQLCYGMYLDLEISDTGCGIDGLTLSKIFDPFFTTKETGKGTGLGLAVVHGIIKQHKGEITVTSVPDQGTTFHIYLPVLSEEMVQKKQDVFEEIPQGKGERILFVDDEPLLVEMMRQTLEGLGYVVSVFTSSVEALATYKKNPDNFDLVITDMTMPEMTGTELTRQLFALRADLPIILCTGFSEAIDETRAMSMGIYGYINKPVDKFTLAKTIKNALQAI